MAKSNLIQSPLTLEQICIDALQNSARHYLKLRNIINFPVSHLAQRLLKVKSKKSLIIIALKKTFADGCYLRAIACGFDLARRQFVFGHFAGLTCKKVGSRITWTKSINVKGIVFNFNNSVKISPIHLISQWTSSLHWVYNQRTPLKIYSK
eukprot:Seg731.13 transcript_id=Seg731.13/GoldUCD/mRNA.D3Y31 product="hypothetical protein" protein_id=Seg731.13/GoldUCD/D3Y31